MVRHASSIDLRNSICAKKVGGPPRARLSLHAFAILLQKLSVGLARLVKRILLRSSHKAGSVSTIVVKASGC